MIVGWLNRAVCAAQHRGSSRTGAFVLGGLSFAVSLPAPGVRGPVDGRMLGELIALAKAHHQVRFLLVIA